MYILWVSKAKFEINVKSINYLEDLDLTCLGLIVRWNNVKAVSTK